jgi:hypothetical protein
MPSSDSLEFAAAYKSWTTASVFNVGPNTKPLEVSKYLVEVKETVDKKAFEALGIDTAQLDLLSNRLSKGMNGILDIVNAYQKVTSSESKEVMEKVCKEKEELKAFVQAYVFRGMLTNLKIDFTIDANKQEIFKGVGKMGSAAKAPSGAIFFMAKYGNWIAIKKMNIGENTKPEEVAMHLTSIRLTVDKKGFEYAGINTLAINTYAEKAIGTMRKSAANLAKAVEILSSADSKTIVEQAAGNNKVLFPIARIYLFKKLLEGLKFYFEVNPDALSAVYPGLKLPGRRGRKPKA